MKATTPPPRKASRIVSICEVVDGAPQESMAPVGQPEVDKVRVNVENARTSLGDVLPSTIGARPPAIN